MDLPCFDAVRIAQPTNLDPRLVTVLCSFNTSYEKEWSNLKIKIGEIMSREDSEIKRMGFDAPVEAIAEQGVKAGGAPGYSRQGREFTLEGVLNAFLAVGDGTETVSVHEGRELLEDIRYASAHPEYRTTHLAAKLGKLILAEETAGEKSKD